MIPTYRNGPPSWDIQYMDAKGTVALATEQLWRFLDDQHRRRGHSHYDDDHPSGFAGHVELRYFMDVLDEASYHLRHTRAMLTAEQERNALIARLTKPKRRRY